MLTSIQVMNGRLRGRRRERGQALVEYAFLLIVLATIGISVIVLAGNQLQATYQNAYDHVVHLADQQWQDQHQQGQQ